MTTLGETPSVTTEARGHVLVITLNRPAKRNAFTVAMLQALSEAYGRLEAEADLRCAALVAAGEHFTAGLDLADVGPAVASGAPLFAEGQVDPLDLFAPRRRKPVVCGVRGYCFTIGIELMLASDVRVAGDDTRFNQLEVGRGIMPFGGATLRFPQVAGWGDAMRWMLTGGFFDAAEALRIGLAQEIVPAAEVSDRTIALAEEIARQAPLAVQATRAAARAALEQGFDAARAELLPAARALMATDDAREGLQSFLERRVAEFSGR